MTAYSECMVENCSNDPWDSDGYCKEHKIRSADFMARLNQLRNSL